MKITSCAITDTGRKRADNQDSFAIDEERDLFVIADGMGGHAGGEVASTTAVGTIEDAFSRLETPETEHGPFGPRTPSRIALEKLAWAVRVAGRSIFNIAEARPELRDMGTTVVALAFVENHAIVANVGDSRCYLVRADSILQLTEDHSVVAEQVKHGVIGPEQAKKSLLRNQLTRSVGYREDVEVDRILRPVEKGDVFVLCSDGLSNLVEEAELQAIASANEPEDAAETLVNLALERGGDDNVTVIVARVDELDPEPKAPTAEISPAGLEHEETTETPLP